MLNFDFILTVESVRPTSYLLLSFRKHTVAHCLSRWWHCGAALCKSRERIWNRYCCIFLKMKVNPGVLLC